MQYGKYNLASVARAPSLAAPLCCFLRSRTCPGLRPRLPARSAHHSLVTKHADHRPFRYTSVSPSSRQQHLTTMATTMATTKQNVTRHFMAQHLWDPALISNFVPICFFLGALLCVSIYTTTTSSIYIPL